MVVYDNFVILHRLQYIDINVYKIE